MKKFQIMIDDRNYSQWNILDAETGKNVDIANSEYPGLLELNPIKEKLFTKDIFSFNSDLSINVLHCSVKETLEFPGILMLDNNKTFGRTENKKRLLYKCIPDDKHLPAFLIPYEIQMGFSKVNKNKYVIFKFDSWKDKHPQGILVQTLGNVDNIEIFYEYQLYCKSLHHSISKFINKTRENIEKRPAAEHISQIFNNKNFTIQDRRNDHYIFSIDPLGSMDFDDAFSIKKMPDGNWKVSVYIANVYFWLESFNLWNSFSKRVSTIYLPDRRRPMLPTILSESLCSLQKQQDRFAFVMDIIVSANGKIIEDSCSFSNALITLEKNYVYEDPKMIATDENYKNLLELTVKMDKEIENSHDVVSYWMIVMNSMCGNFMSSNKFGIFRSSNYIDKNKNDNVSDDIKPETKRVIKMWNNASGQYVLYKDGEHQHEVMNIKSYIHITSPIRRLVDLLNQMFIFDRLGLIRNISKDANNFLLDWLEKLDYINGSMRSIRKVQTDCEVVNRCFTNPDIMKIEYTGVVFDKMKKSDNTYSYMIYLEDIKLLSRIICRTDVPNYSKNKFKLYLFEDEDKIKNKIRLHMVDSF
jgi:exoribonuclease R